MSIENSFLKKLIETKDWDTVLDKDIDTSYFSGANKRAFKWISDFKIKYGELPDKETFKKRFPEITLDIEAPETVGYYCDELRQKIKHNKLVATICAGPTIIGHLGYLKGRNYTCFTSMNEDFGGTYMDKYCVQDGNLITGRSAAASIDFAFMILEAVKGKDEADKVKTSIYY